MKVFQYVSTDKLLLIISITVILILIIYVYKSYKDLRPVTLKVMRFLIKNLFLFLLIPAIVFFFYDYFFGEEITNPSHKRAHEFLLDLCKILFSAGVFSVGLNFLDSLNVFKRNFKKIVMSNEFDELMTNKIDALAYSPSHLLKQNNIEEIWQTVTLCKYKKEFPELYDKLKSKIRNDLFTKNNISYYYKNFQVNYKIKLLEDKYLEINERTSYTIIRPNRDEFEFDFSTSFNIEDENNGVDVKFYIKNGEQRDFEEIECVEETIKKIKKKTFSKMLSGHKEYHMESDVVLKQNIDEDRHFAFGSARLMDDLTVFIEHDKNINVIFKPLNNNKLYHNGTHHDDKHSYINRDVLLPGEKFIMFFYRKNQEIQ
ncbi:hypothetical protein MQE36_05305 [Zhouia spongiae]|uniref:FHA domain-containing protein n=1 Tax=Zhouia spongiae TaxID=2202721 RepID=A0ABY3YPM5_9FLAO|nr:hypothetical protein [Zhouia spongiae]UNY99762.1 hypothetical protein MQE36_05305 [Zhouia spongiae]